MSQDIECDVYWNHADKSVAAIKCCDRVIVAPFVPWHFHLTHGLPALLMPVILARMATQYDTYQSLGEDDTCPC